MAQYQPLVNPTSLANLNQVPLDMTLEGMDWFNQARNADSQQFQDLPGLLAHEQALRPLKQQQMQIANDTGLAQLPGIKAQSSILQRKNKMEDITFDDDVKTKLSDLATKLKKNDIEQIEAEGQRLLTSMNPEERWRGAQLLAASKEMFALNHKQYQAIELEGVKHRNAKELMQMQIDAGRFNKTPRAGKSPEEILASMGFEKASVYYDAKAQAAEEAGNKDHAQYYRDQADKMKQAYERAKVLQGQAAAGGKIDAPAVTGLPATPQAQPQGFGGGQAPTDRVRVIGPDGRTGTIPRSQLKDALSSGYKEAK